MTSTDHTARSCPRVRKKPKSQSFPFTDRQLYPLSREQQEQLTDEMKRVGALFGASVIRGLLDYNDAYRSRIRGKHNPLSPWPLVPSQVSGLHAALFHLQQYIGTLRLEPGG